MVPEAFDAANFIKTPQPDSGELVSQVISLFSITVMSMLFGIKTYNVQYKYLSYSRWLILTLYLMSWGFTLTATIFVSTNNGNFMSCFLSELACDIFYSGTKIVIYSWLIEKVWVVSASRQSRWRTPSYRFHVTLLTPYVAILTLMIVFHTAELQHDGVCINGLQPIASIPLLVYDFLFNMYMTILFVKPLMNSNVGRGIRIDWKASRLHHVARRTLVASIVAQLVSFANILTLTVLNGRERGVLCLTCCTVDVTINVITIHWVTTNSVNKTSKEYITQVQSGTQNRNGTTHHDNDVDEDIPPTANDLSSKKGVHYFKEYKPEPKQQQDDIPAPAYDISVMESRENSYFTTTTTTTMMNSRLPNKLQFEEEDLGSNRTATSSRPCSIQESQSSRKSLTKSERTVAMGVCNIY